MIHTSALPVFSLRFRRVVEADAALFRVEASGQGLAGGPQKLHIVQIMLAHDPHFGASSLFAPLQTSGGSRCRTLSCRGIRTTIPPGFSCTRSLQGLCRLPGVSGQARQYRSRCHFLKVESKSGLILRPHSSRSGTQRQPRRLADSLGSGERSAAPQGDPARGPTAGDKLQEIHDRA